MKLRALLVLCLAPINNEGVHRWVQVLRKKAFSRIPYVIWPGFRLFALQAYPLPDLLGSSLSDQYGN